MKRTDKVLWLLLLIGLVGAAVTIGVIVGDHMLLEYVDMKTYVLQEPVNSVSIDTEGANIQLVPSKSDYRVEAYASAWLESPLSIDEMLTITQQGGEVTITQIPLPPKFLGMLPQPYALDLRLYFPQEVCEAIKGDLQ